MSLNSWIQQRKIQLTQYFNSLAPKRAPADFPDKRKLFELPPDWFPRKYPYYYFLVTRILVIGDDHLELFFLFLKGLENRVNEKLAPNGEMAKWYMNATGWQLSDRTPGKEKTVIYHDIHYKNSLSVIKHDFTDLVKKDFDLPFFLVYRELDMNLEGEIQLYASEGLDLIAIGSNVEGDTTPIADFLYEWPWKFPVAASKGGL